MTRTDLHPKNTSDSTQNNVLYNTQQSGNTNDKLNNQVMHTVYHPQFDLTAVRRHVQQQNLDESIEVNMESVSSNNSDRVDTESDSTNNGGKEREGGDED